MSHLVRQHYNTFGHRSSEFETVFFFASDCGLFEKKKKNTKTNFRIELVFGHKYEWQFPKTYPMKNNWILTHQILRIKFILYLPLFNVLKVDFQFSFYTDLCRREYFLMDHRIYSTVSHIFWKETVKGVDNDVSNSLACPHCPHTSPKVSFTRQRFWTLRIT